MHSDEITYEIIITAQGKTRDKETNEGERWQCSSTLVSLSHVLPCAVSSLPCAFEMEYQVARTQTLLRDNIGLIVEGLSYKDSLTVEEASI